MPAAPASRRAAHPAARARAADRLALGAGRGDRRRPQRVRSDARGRHRPDRRVLRPCGLSVPRSQRRALLARRPGDPRRRHRRDRRVAGNSGPVAAAGRRAGPWLRLRPGCRGARPALSLGARARRLRRHDRRSPPPLQQHLEPPLRADQRPGPRPTRRPRLRLAARHRQFPVSRPGRARDRGPASGRRAAVSCGPAARW